MSHVGDGDRAEARVTTGQAPITKNYPVPNTKSGEVQKSWNRERLEVKELKKMSKHVSHDWFVVLSNYARIPVA